MEELLVVPVGLLEMMGRQKHPFAPEHLLGVVHSRLLD
jgi:hypothetical protein